MVNVGMLFGIELWNEINVGLCLPLECCSKLAFEFNGRDMQSIILCIRLISFALQMNNVIRIKTSSSM